MNTLKAERAMTTSDKLREIADDDDFRDDDDDEIFGYERLGCGHVQDEPGECEMCMGSAVEPMYF